jgi:hypothetical protein
MGRAKLLSQEMMALGMTKGKVLAQREGMGRAKLMAVMAVRTTYGGQGVGSSGGQGPILPRSW